MRTLRLAASGERCTRIGRATFLKNYVAPCEQPEPQSRDWEHLVNFGFIGEPGRSLPQITPTGGIDVANTIWIILGIRLVEPSLISCRWCLHREVMERVSTFRRRRILMRMNHFDRKDDYEL